MSDTALAPRRIGRPPVFATIEDFENGINAYLADCDAREKPYTMAGLANGLGISRQALLGYEHRDPRFLVAVKRARALVEQRVEEELLSREKQVTGHIFNLKNNFGWRDVQDIEHTHNVVVLGSLTPPAIEISTSATSAPALSPSDTEVIHSLTVDGDVSSVA